MRFLMIAAITSSMLVPVLAQGDPANVAESNSPSASPSDRAAAARRETEDLEKARSIDALKDSNLRMQAQSADKSGLAQESVEQQHPEWFVETNKYKACPWDMCPSPPPQR
jgi:hypothetical protein